MVGEAERGREKELIEEVRTDIVVRGGDSDRDDVMIMSSDVMIMLSKETTADEGDIKSRGAVLSEGSKESSAEGVGNNSCSVTVEERTAASTAEELKGGREVKTEDCRAVDITESLSILDDVIAKRLVLVP